MKIIVAGAGLVGFHIARYLAAAGNDVIVIDQRDDLVRKIGDSLDIQGIQGHAAHPEVLENAGASDTEVFIAVTQVDEVNMMACQVAHSLFNVPTKIARVRQQEYLLSRWQSLYRREHLPIDHIITPELELAHAIALRLEIPGALNVVPFADRRVRLIALRCTQDTPVARVPLRQLTLLFPDLHLVCVGVRRAGKFFIPHADDQLLPGDDVHFIVDTNHIDRALPAFGYPESMSERIVIIGGGNIGLVLAHDLEDAYPGMSIKIIENSEKRAEYIAGQLKRSTVLLGDTRDREILEEAEVSNAHSVVAVTNNDEINIIASILAKSMGCQRNLALVNNSTYNMMSGNMSLDVMINPRETTVSTVLSHVRKGRLKSVRTIDDGGAEIYEAEALETSPIVGVPLKELNLSGGIIAGAILRGDEVITPRGDTIVQAHDRVILVGRSDAVRKVEQLLAVRLDYF